MDSGNGSLAIEAKEVTKIYRGVFSREVQALDRLDLSVPAGEIFGLLGPNGAGKTTLVKILLDICRPTSGSTSLFGVSSRQVRARNRVGYLPEDHQFPPHLTGLGAMELYGSLSGLSVKESRHRGAEALERVGMTQWGDVKTRKYSKGMKQRLGIAQALFHDPDLLILDEPTDGVDPVGRKAIRDLLLEFHGKGKTIFINSHLLLEVEMICHRVVILHRGEVLRIGTVEEMTGATDAYRLNVGGNREEALGIVKETAESAERGEDGIRFVASTPEVLDRTTRALFEAGHTVRELVPIKHTLEEVFIQLIESGKGDSPGGEKS